MNIILLIRQQEGHSACEKTCFCFISPTNFNIFQSPLTPQKLASCTKTHKLLLNVMSASCLYFYA